MSKNNYEVSHCSECGRMVGDGKKICDDCEKDRDRVKVEERDTFVHNQILG